MPSLVARDAFLVARKVRGVASIVQTEQHLGRIFPAEEERIADRTVAVHALQIQTRAPRVPQKRLIVVVRDRRSVCSDVVRDELPEHGPTRRDALRLTARRIPRVASPARATKRMHDVWTDAQMRKIGKHPRVAMTAQRSVDAPPRSHAVIAGGPLLIPP